MLKKRIIIIFLIILVTSLTLGGGLWWGFELGKQFPQTLIIKGVSNIDPDPLIKADFSTFWQAWQVINEDYLKNEEITSQQKVFGAIKGLVGSLDDPYSEFFNPEDNKKFQEDIKGIFGGIGAEIGIRNNKLLIIAPLKGTPASQIGLKAGDHIFKVDDVFTDGLTVLESVKIIRGQVDSEVVLTILREDWDEPKEFKITRANIVIPTLDSEMKDDIAYIQLYSFNANTIPFFQRAMVEALNNQARGLVLDLRNNPGGFLNVAVDLAGWFLERGSLVVSEIGISESRQDFRANGNAALANFPVIVLINKGSASASEIVAGALRDNRNIKLVGEKSFGKGTVQELEDLKDGSSLKITIANWVLPNGQILEGEGLQPDYEVELTDEDIENDRDPQLEKALEIINSEVLVQE